MSSTLAGPACHLHGVASRRSCNQRGLQLLSRPGVLFSSGSSKITYPGVGQPSLGCVGARLRRASCSARALSTSKVSVPATAMADKLITSWMAEPIASLGTQILASKPTIQESASGFQMKLVSGRSAISMDSLRSPTAVTIHLANEVLRAVTVQQPDVHAPV